MNEVFQKVDENTKHRFQIASILGVRTMYTGLRDLPSHNSTLITAIIMITYFSTHRTILKYSFVNGQVVQDTEV